MVLAHHLFDLITQHRSKKKSIPLHLLQDDQVDPSAQTEDSTGERQSDPNPSIDTNTLRSMFQARDLALEKIMTATAALSLSPSPSEVTAPAENSEESETIECPSCREVIPCTFPPLRSAVAVYESQRVAAVPSSEYEPKHTNWTADYIG
jgi:hypothetical protein